MITGFWLQHFSLYLQTERLLSDLFTVVLVAGLAAVVLCILFGRPVRWVLGAAGITIVVLVLVGSGYYGVGRQFRAACLRADDALARTVTGYPGARQTSNEVFVDYNSADAPLRNYLSVTHLFPLAWNYARNPRYTLPLATTAGEVRKYYRPHFAGWHAPAPRGQVPDFYWRGGQAVQIDVGNGIRQAAQDRTTVTTMDLYINGWSRPEHY